MIAERFHKLLKALFFAQRIRITKGPSDEGPFFLSHGNQDSISKVGYRDGCAFP